MAKVYNNIFLRGLRGALGDPFVIRTTRSGKTIIANKPTFDKNRIFTTAQKKHQEAFRQASAYAKSAKTEELYVQKAKETGSISYNLAIADWFGAPKILEINMDGWTGQMGQTIRMKARDNFMVACVAVVIRDTEGCVLEAGEAIQSKVDGSWWHYTT